jgi:DNA-binding response OmpR family regulator
MPTVLVVDDDQQTRVWSRRILEAKGYQVEEAVDGKAALAICEGSPPSLIVLDTLVDNMGGLGVIRELRSRVRSSKILAISGDLFSGHTICRTARALGAHDALARPFDAETFLRHVETLLSHT